MWSWLKVDFKKLEQSIMQRMINEALDNATVNGHDMVNMAAIEVANDLTEYDADFEDCTPRSLVRFIQDWQRRQRKARQKQIEKSRGKLKRDAGHQRQAEFTKWEQGQ